MSTKQFFVNAASRHAVFVQRLAGGEAKKTLPFIKRLQKEITAKLIEGNLTEFGTKRLAVLYDDLHNLTTSIYNEMGEMIQEDMIPFGEYEAKFTSNLAKKGMDVTSFAVPATETIQAAIETKVMEFAPGQGSATIGEALDKFSKAKAKQIVQSVKDWMVLGKSSQEIVGDIRNITANVQRHNAEALVRTITNHVSTVARMTTLKENADVLEGYEVVATLDAQTTLLCAGLDGKVYELDEVEYPPYHWNCRTTLIPRVKKEFDLGADVTGERPSIGSDGVELVGANKTFGGWLKDQSTDFKQEYFNKFSDGDEKYKLFNSGALKIDQFTDSKGAELTLSELESLADVSLGK